MKRIFCFMACIFLCFCFVTLGIFTNKTSKDTFAIVSESQIENQQDIVSVNYSDLTSNLQADATYGQTPFDSSTQSLRPGYSITPRVSTSAQYNQVDSVRYSVPQFIMNNYQSIFMWIYFPDDPYENFYSFDISFSSQQGDKISWHFTPYELDDFLSDSYSNSFGWKFVEFSYLDATKTSNVGEDTVFFILEISYKYISDDNLGELGFNFDTYITNGTLSFYHVFLGNRTSTSSGVLLNLNYVYYSVNQSFLSELDSICLNESYTIKSINEMFNYVYVGKSNVLSSSTQNNRFVWNINISSSLSNFDIYSGETYKFETSGNNVFTITLSENRNVRNSSQSNVSKETIITYKKNLSIYEYSYGSFEKGFYDITADTRYQLYFTVANGFTLTDELEVTSSNDNIFVVESVSYNEQDGTYSIIVKGLKNGRASISVSSSGIRPGEAAVKSYTASATLEVSGATMSFGYGQMILIILAFYVLAGSVFAFFTIKNIKKNRQRQNRQ